MMDWNIFWLQRMAFCCSVKNTIAYMHRIQTILWKININDIKTLRFNIMKRKNFELFIGRGIWKSENLLFIVLKNLSNYIFFYQLKKMTHSYLIKKILLIYFFLKNKVLDRQKSYHRIHWVIFHVEMNIGVHGWYNQTSKISHTPTTNILIYSPVHTHLAHQG